jgi:hypothetical protein
MSCPRRPSAAAALRPAALLLALVAGAAVAQAPREQAVHAHGTTSITLALVDGTLQLELSAPGMDVVGFEHAPANAQQERAVAEAIATLERSGDWLAFEPVGACTVAAVDAHSHGFEADASPDAEAAAGHDGHDGHEHADGHGEFHLKLSGSCATQPGALRIDLASRFAGIDMIRVDLITDSLQDRVELVDGQTRVPLAR